MPSRTHITTRALVAIACSLLPGLLAAQVRADSARATPHREVAITFDDVPGVHLAGRCDYAALERLNRKLVSSIKRHKIPALGLVNEGHGCDKRKGALEDLLGMWLDAGLELGNHSHSHFDLNTTPLDTYTADVIRGEATTRRLLHARGMKLRYFRHPLLHAGKDIETKQAFEQFLAERGYQVAPVTIDNQEWVFAAVYARALRRGDRATIQRVGAAYVPYMEQVFEFFERLSVDVVGYEIKQVLLLHDNPLNADYLDELVAMMKRRGYRFVSLEHALSDPAYRLPDRYAGAQGLSWLHRWAITRGMKPTAEPREPAWIRKLFEAR